MTGIQMNAILVSTDVLGRILGQRKSPDEPIDAILRRCISARQIGATAPSEPRGTSSGKGENDRPAAFHSKLVDVISGRDRSIFAIDALVSDLRRLAGPEFASFYPRLARRVAGRTRMHIATSPKGVYPLRPDLAEHHSVPIAPGWFLGTNIANREKLKILRAACRLRGLHCNVAFGSNCDLQRPSALGLECGDEPTFGPNVG